MRRSAWGRSFIVAGVGLSALALGGCETTAGTVASIGAVALVAGGSTAAQQLEQVYYLGVFDPLEQVPPSVYRLTVRGQASSISRMRFASGWVPANLVDSLNTSLEFGADGKLKIEGDGKSAITPDRRLILFGPEGFREAPDDHRLVLVMSASPEDFFAAVGSTLEATTQLELEQLGVAERERILRETYRLSEEERTLDALEARVGEKEVGS
jgi:hypothetical protein